MRKIDRERRAAKVQRNAERAQRQVTKARARIERGRQRAEHAQQLAALSEPRTIDGRLCRIPVEQEASVRPSVARVGEFFGRDWLDELSDHPARMLWRRIDEGATGELVMWGQALERLEAAVAPSLLRRWQARAKDADVNNALGALFEVFAAALFQDVKHPVLDPDDRRRGFDFGVDVGAGRQLQVSVKNLMRSRPELRLRAFADALRADLKVRLPSGARLALRVFPRATSSPQFLESERQALVSAIVAAVNVNAWRVRDVGPWCALIDPLEPLGGNDFSSAGPSFTAVVAMTHVPNENQRVAGNAIGVACEKFRRHCAKTQAGVANVFFIKIPTSVNVEEAREAVRSEFAKPANACISAGYLYRASWLTRNKARTFYIGHEIYEQKNPLANVSLDSVCPKISLTVPFGRVQSTVPTWDLEEIGGQRYVLDGEHAIVVGSHVYRGTSLSLVARHGIEVIWDRADDDRVVVVAGHDDRLVLL